MVTLRGSDALPARVAEVVNTAVGQEHRKDPVGARTGGPAGNARLTAWLGLLLLVVFVVECGTLVSLQGLLSAHIFIGALLVPLALAKTATTTWRIVRYYAGNAAYRQAGPPPLLLRLLGPLVVLTSLAVLGTGLALIALGSRGREPFLTVLGFGLGPLMLHKAAFVLWLGVTALHTLVRLVPAVLVAGRRLGPRDVPGTGLRAGVLGLTVAVSVLTGVLVLSASHYHSERHDGFRHIQDQSLSLCPTCDTARPAGNAGATTVDAALA